MTTPRSILLAATGLSPQILTETLYALGVAPGEGQAPFIPTEVHLITTAQGAELARTSLLHPDGGAFHALLADYPQWAARRLMPATSTSSRTAPASPWPTSAARQKTPAPPTASPR